MDIRFKGCMCSYCRASRISILFATLNGVPYARDTCLKVMSGKKEKKNQLKWWEWEIKIIHRNPIKICQSHVRSAESQVHLARQHICIFVRVCLYSILVPLSESHNKLDEGLSEGSYFRGWARGWHERRVGWWRWDSGRRGIVRGLTPGGGVLGVHHTRGVHTTNKNS